MDRLVILSDLLLPPLIAVIVGWQLIPVPGYLGLEDHDFAVDRFALREVKSDDLPKDLKDMSLIVTLSGISPNQFEISSNVQGISSMLRIIFACSVGDLSTNSKGLNMSPLINCLRYFSELGTASPGFLTLR